MRTPNANKGKKELSFKQIANLMALGTDERPCPCEITPRESQPPSVEERAEFGVKDTDPTERE